MSRLDSVRKLATSAVGSAALGAAAGGGIAHATGGDVRSGAMSGAMYGGGARLAAGGISAGSRALGARMPKVSDWAKQKMIGNNFKRQQFPLGGRGLYNTKHRGYLATQKGANRLQTGFSTMTRAMNKITGFKAGLGGGLGAGLGATFGSGGGRSFSQSSLSERKEYLGDVRQMEMKYNLREAMMKKQIWAGA